MHHASCIMHHRLLLTKVEGWDSVCWLFSEIQDQLRCYILHHAWCTMHDGGRPPSVENDLLWNMTFSGRQPSVEDKLQWKTTFGGRRPLVGDDLWWKTTFSERRPLVEDDLWWILTCCLVHFAAFFKERMTDPVGFYHIEETRMVPKCHVSKDLTLSGFSGSPQSDFLRVKLSFVVVFNRMVSPTSPTNLSSFQNSKKVEFTPTPFLLKRTMSLYMTFFSTTLICIGMNWF